VKMRISNGLSTLLKFKFEETRTTTRTRAKDDGVKAGRTDACSMPFYGLLWARCIKLGIPDLRFRYCFFQMEGDLFHPTAGKGKEFSQFRSDFRNCKSPYETFS